MEPKQAEGAQPTGIGAIPPDIFELVQLEGQPHRWAEARARIRALGHPTNDGEAVPAGGDAGDAAGGDGAQATDPAAGGSPFAAVLEAAGDNREAVAEALKSVEPKITKRFTEAAEFRKQWEPFGPLNLAEIGPEGVAQALGLAQLFADPAKADSLITDRDAFEQTWEAVGASLGYFDDEPGGQSAEAAGEGEPPAWAKPLFDDLATRQERDQQQAQERIDREAEEKVQAQLDEIRDKPGFDEPRVLQLAQVHALQGEDNAILKGWEDLQAILGGAERGLVERKENQPPPAQQPAQPDLTPEKAKNYRDAREIAARRFAATA